jgi:hypothetical protein
MPILYVKMQKALHGLQRSALLFYHRLVSDLEHASFVINPSDPCIANKQVGGNQMMVCWHVNDLKVSHIDPTEVTCFGNWLSGKYGVTIGGHRGKIHDYLGMILNYSHKGKINFPEEISGYRATAAADHLFTVRDAATSQLLLEDQARAFHHMVAQLLFLSARARHDIQPVTAFLTIRVQHPDKDDWGKQKQLFCNIFDSPSICHLIFLPTHSQWHDGGSMLPMWCIMIVTAIQGAGMSLGQGMVMSYSWKQK